MIEGGATPATRTSYPDRCSAPCLPFILVPALPRQFLRAQTSGLALQTMRIELCSCSGREFPAVPLAAPLLLALVAQISKKDEAPLAFRLPRAVRNESISSSVFLLALQAARIIRLRNCGRPAKEEMPFG